jgi:hypothetical protein
MIAVLIKAEFKKMAAFSANPASIRGELRMDAFMEKMVHTKGVRKTGGATMPLAAISGARTITGTFMAPMENIKVASIKAVRFSTLAGDTRAVSNNKAVQNHCKKSKPLIDIEGGVTTSKKIKHLVKNKTYFNVYHALNSLANQFHAACRVKTDNH